MHVLLVLPGAETGGVQRHVLDVARGLLQRGVDVLIVVGSDGPLCESLTRARIAHVVIPMRSRRDRARVVGQLRTVIRTTQRDLVHTHGPLAGVLGRDAAAREHVPFVHTLHGRGLHDELCTARSMMHRLQLVHFLWSERRWNARSAALIAVSVASAHGTGARRERIVTIPNGIDAGAFASGADRRAAFGWPRDAPVVATIGRLAEQKDPLAFLRCAARVAPQRPDVRFLLVGDGPLRAAVERAIDEHGLRSACVVTGDRTDVADMLATCTVFVLLSRYEGLPLSALEAGAAGRPMVAVDIDGVRDAFRSEDTALLVPPCDDDAAAGAVLRLLADPLCAAAIGARAQEMVRTHHSHDRMVDETLAVYRRVLGEAA